MENPVLQGPTPVCNPYATIRKPETRLVTEQPLNDCAKSAATHFKVLGLAFELFSYKAPKPDSWMEAMASGLFQLAAPALGTYFVIKSLPRMIMGGIGTAALAPLYTVEWVGHKVKQIVQSAGATQQQLEHLMQQFINRMKERMVRGTPQEADFLRQHPTKLIHVAVVSLAFISRREPQGIKVGNRILTMEVIKGQDSNRKQYLQDVFDIQAALLKLPLSPDEDEAWNELKRMLKVELDTSNFPQEEGWEIIPDRNEYIQLAIQKNPQLNENSIRILVIGYLLARDLTSDPVFNRLWAASMQ